MRSRSRSRIMVVIVAGTLSPSRRASRYGRTISPARSGSTVLAAKPMTVVRNAWLRRVGPDRPQQELPAQRPQEIREPSDPEQQRQRPRLRVADLAPHLRQVRLPEEPAEERQRQAGHGQGLQVGAHQVRAAADSTITVTPSLWESESYCSFPAFVVIGLLVYQLTMPATADTGGGFGAWWARLRSHVAQNWVERHYERKDEVKVPAAVRTADRAARPRVRDDPGRGTRHRRGRPVGRRLRRRRRDGQGARAADRASASAPTAPSHEARPDPAEAGRSGAPARASSSRCGSRRGSASRCAWAAASSTSPTSRRRAGREGLGRRSGFASIAGAVTGELGPGEIEIDHVGSVAIETRSSQVRIANVAGSFEARGATRRLPRPRHRRPGAPGGEGRRSRARGSSPARCGSPAPAARSASATCAAPSPRKRSARRSS